MRACDEFGPLPSSCLVILELPPRRFERVARGNYFYFDALRVVSYSDVRAMTIRIPFLFDECGSMH